MILQKSNLNFRKTNDDDKAIIVTGRGALINLFNPQLTLFFFAFLPQYISNNIQNYVKESFLLGILFMILTFLIVCGYGILAGLMKKFATKSPKRLQYIQQLFGIIFIVFAINLYMSSL